MSRGYIQNILVYPEYIEGGGGYIIIIYPDYIGGVIYYYIFFTRLKKYDRGVGVLCKNRANFFSIA